MKLLPLERGNPAPRSAVAYWRSAAPFVVNDRGVLVHRPRAVTTYHLHRHAHIGVSLMCGNTQVGGRNFAFVDDVPADRLLCARCEEQAARMALPSADSLCNRHVHVGGVKAQRHCCGGDDAQA